MTKKERLYKKALEKIRVNLKAGPLKTKLEHAIWYIVLDAFHEASGQKATSSWGK